MYKLKKYFLIGWLFLVLQSCTAVKSTWNSFSGSIEAMFYSPRVVKNKITNPVRMDSRLSVLWVGHSTLLIQLDDKFILTDPVFTSTAAFLSKRLVEPGIDYNNLPPIDAVLISHMHLDHLSLGSLNLIEDKVKKLIVPKGGLVYVPNYQFESNEIKLWESINLGKLRITSTPLEHNGWRYGLDYAWMDSSYTGYLIEYNGLKVYFAGDTAYDSTLFIETGKKFPGIDLAFLPVAPIHPREYSKSRHAGPEEAIKAFIDLKAGRMVPIHYDTFPESYDSLGEAESRLKLEMKRRNLTDKDIVIMKIGEQKVFIGK